MGRSGGVLERGKEGVNVRDGEDGCRGGGNVFVNQDDLFERVIFPSQCLKFILKIIRL